MTTRIAILVALLALAPAAHARPSKALKKRLAALAELDAARTDALTLIRDASVYVKGNQTAQRDVSRRTARVDKAHARVASLLKSDLRKLRKKKKARAALLSARPSALNAWERALLQRLADERVIQQTIETVRALPKAERPSAHQLEQLRVTNDYRMRMGLPALGLQVQLNAAAADHSVEMRRLRYFDHTSPTQGRETPFKRAKLSGFEGSAVGENIASGYSSPRAVHKGWLESPGHHRNIVDADWEVMGVANAGQLWTQVFGRVSETSAK